MKGKTQYRWLKSRTYDEGNILRLQCKVVGPNLARCALFVFGAFNVMFGVSFLFFWFFTGNNGPFGLIFLGHFLLCTLLVSLGFHLWVARILCGHRLDFVMSQDFIKIGGWFRYKTSPNMVLNFTHALHPRAENEANAEQRRGKNLTPYYRKTIQIIMYNGEVPTVLTSIYNNEKAVTAILIRLQNMQTAIQQQQMQPRGA